MGGARAQGLMNGLSFGPPGPPKTFPTILTVCVCKPLICYLCSEIIENVSLMCFISSGAY